MSAPTDGRERETEADRGEAPRFVGGPEDGKTLEERFPPGHLLHGKLPNGVSIPTNAPPLPPGPMHVYEFIGGDYIYQGEADE